MAYGSDAPDAWFAMRETERDARSELSSDQCIIDGDTYYLRGRICIPVTETNDIFYWGVWTEVTSDQFNRASELWYQEGRESEPPYQCQIATSLPCYSETLGLRVSVKTQQLGDRPHVTVLDNHLIRDEQRSGITLHRVKEIHDFLIGDAS